MKTKISNPQFPQYSDETPRVLPKLAAFPSGQVAAGHVRIERTSYHYGQQGQTSVAHHDVRDIPEGEAIKWISGQFVSVIWPDGAMELYDLAVTPCRVTAAIEPSFGYIERAAASSGIGTKEQVKLSKLPNVAFGYYRAMEISAQERASFVAHKWEI